MGKDATGLATQSLNSSAELARAILDNINDLQKAASELSSRISYTSVQLAKAKADAEKISDKEVRQEALKNYEAEEAYFKIAKSKLDSTNVILSELKGISSALDVEMSKKADKKSREEQVISIMKQSLRILNGIIKAQKDYFKALRELDLIRFYVETLENLIAGEINVKDAQKALRTPKK